MAKIYIVEDDKKIKEELSVFLVKNGYNVQSENDFSSVIENIISSNADLVLLDINLPQYDGYYICKEIRKKSDIAIIIVTSRNTEIDELMSMNLGADDFITKPYNTQILLARIESVLKRTNKLSTIKNIIEYKNVIVDISRSNLSVDNKNTELTKNELKIINYMMNNLGKIVSREELMIYLWDSEMFVDDNTLTVNINRLRRKLADLGVEEFIETRRSQGYIIV